MWYNLSSFYLQQIVRGDISTNKDIALSVVRHIEALSLLSAAPTSKHSRARSMNMKNWAPWFVALRPVSQ